MKTHGQLIVVIAFLISIGFFAGCSRKAREAQSNIGQPKNLLEKRTAALARDFNCPLLVDAIRKSVGTNSVFSFHVQRVLNNNAKVAATGILKDLVQSGERIEAVFEINSLREELLWDGKCVAKLECPTNYLSTLMSKDMFFESEWGLVFDLSENHHDLKFSKGSGEDHSVESYIVITITGKLTAIEEPD